MPQHISAAANVVPDEDAAIAFDIGTLGFIFCGNTDMVGGKRWVTVTPVGAV